MSEPSKIELALVAAAELLGKLDAVHADPDYLAVWRTAQQHLGPYQGINYRDELEELRLRLADFY